MDSNVVALIIFLQKNLIVLNRDDEILEDFVLQLSLVMQMLNAEQVPNASKIEKSRELQIAYSKVKNIEKLPKECETMIDRITRLHYKHQGENKENDDTSFEKILKWFLKSIVKTRNQYVQIPNW